MHISLLAFLLIVTTMTAAEQEELRVLSDTSTHLLQLGTTSSLVDIKVEVVGVLKDENGKKMVPGPDGKVNMKQKEIIFSLYYVQRNKDGSRQQAERIWTKTWGVVFAGDDSLRVSAAHFDQGRFYVVYNDDYLKVDMIEQIPDAKGVRKITTIPIFKPSNAVDVYVTGATIIPTADALFVLVKLDDVHLQMWEVSESKCRMVWKR